MHTCVRNIHCCFKNPLILHCCRWCVGFYGLFWLKPTCSYPHISNAGSKLQPRPPSGHWGVTVSQSVETHTNILLVLVILGHSTSVSLCPYEGNVYFWIVMKTQSDIFANWTPDAGFQNKLNEGRMMSSYTNTCRFISSQIQLPSFLPLWASAVMSQIHRLRVCGGRFGLHGKCMCTENTYWASLRVICEPQKYWKIKPGNEKAHPPTSLSLAICQPLVYYQEQECLWI